MNHILIYNVNNFWRQNAMESVFHAALRWGAVVRVMTEYPVNGLFAYKFHMHTIGWQPDDRILHLDADMVVKQNCPSPFELVAPDHFGAVRCNQDDDPYVNMIQRQQWELACTQSGLSIPYSNNLFLNGGLLLWTHNVHNYVFDSMIETFGDMPTSGGLEQAVQSLALAHTNTPVEWLPKEFNRVGETVWNGTDDAFIWHFAKFKKFRGKDQAEKIDACQWRMT